MPPLCRPGPGHLVGAVLEEMLVAAVERAGGLQVIIKCSGEVQPSEFWRPALRATLHKIVRPHAKGLRAIKVQIFQLCRLQSCHQLHQQGDAKIRYGSATSKKRPS